jgi:hypothetical protein
MTAQTITGPKWADVVKAMEVNLPEIDTEGVKVSRFEVRSDNIRNMLLALKDGRGAHSGTYTRLDVDGRLWMSDTTAERRDHMEPLWQMWNHGNVKRVLINGLGLGMIVNAALTMPWIEHIDIVEREERVARLIGGHYAADPRVSIHVADAYEQAKRWPAGTRWDVGWSDIWPDMSEDDLPSMARLNRSYGRRCDWHRCWGIDEIRRHVEADKRRGW